MKNLKILTKARELILDTKMLALLLILKVVVYYCLIDVNILDNFLVLASALLFWGLFIGLTKSRFKYKFPVFFVIYAFFSIIMFADTMYFNYYNQTVSIQQVYQVSNVAKVPSSFVATLIPASFFILWDIPFAIYYFRKESKRNKDSEKNNNGKRRIYTCLISVSLILFLAVNPFQNIFVKKINSVEFFSNHIRDIVEVSSDAFHKELWEPQEVLEVVNASTEEEPLIEDTLEGIAKGKNLIVIQLEAYQNFLIGSTYNEQVLTPNINALLEQDSIYFNNYYSTIGKGNTADAEFSTLNSLYPVIDGESYRLYTENTYNGLPWQLKEEGYATYGFHGNEPSFWNRENAYPYQGIDNFYHSENLDASDVIGLGVSDSSMFRQMVDIVKEEEKPFFSFVVSLTSHHPYEMPKEHCELEILPEDEGSKFAGYLQAIHYTDKAIGELVASLKENGLYEDTVIALYGDHHGLNCTMDDNDVYVGRYLNKDYGYEEMLKVPCIIHIPGSGVNKTVSTLGCMVDFLPTVASLMGLDIEQPYIMGQNLLTAEHGFAAFTAYLFDGSFAYDDVMFHISREGIFEGSKAWNRHTLEEVAIDEYKEEYEKAVELKAASEQIMEQDLIADYVNR